ncbi:MAG: bifunctional 5,10-methylenetetrahydrofolate dehydrogenase/5,10-methenyltetrahydrofolate cyclohydrolase [Oscillospiraceae bacterium]|nr:bifunctional 5,10-methylenetetrahydrofolate dehydrogenase/5,10-methenyltetrahydrofolate cyclohydrolase [Oscillospiraceae bacterium]
MAIIIDGKALAAKLKRQVKEAASALPRQPGLAVVLIGDNPASRTYLASKEKDCRDCGFLSFEYRLPEDTREEELLELIHRLNEAKEVDGILIQMPLPEHMDSRNILQAVAVEKDVDGFHPVNVGRLSIDDPLFVPCTPAGIMEMLREYQIPISGKRCVVVGRSNTVGKPMGRLLLQEDGTVTVCHTKTVDLGSITREADILVSAAGVAGLITADMVKEGAVVIDVAMNRKAGGWCGDVDFDAVAAKASYITPVPGGVGPTTRAVLMRNLLEAAKLHMGV